MNFLPKNNNNGYPKRYNPLLEESSFSGESPELEYEKKQANKELKNIGDFVQGSNNTPFGTNQIDSSNNTLALSIQNPTTGILQASLFQFDETLVTGVQNLPPSVLSPTTIVTGPSSIYSAFCPFNNSLYVIDDGNDTVTVIDCSIPGGVITTVIALPLGSTLFRITYCPINNKMYVCGTATTNITIIDCATNTISGIILVPNQPASNLVYNSIKNSIYYCDLINLIEIDCNTNTIAAVIPFITVNATEFTFNPILNRLYGVTFTVNSLSIIDCVANVVLPSIVTPLIFPETPIFSPYNNSIYVVGQFQQLVEFNPATNLFGVIINYGVGFLLSIYAVSYNTLNNLIYIVTDVSSIVEFNPATNTVTNVYALPIPFAGQLVYNSNDNSGWIIYLAGAFNVQSFVPLLAPTPIINYFGGVTPAMIYNDSQTKPFIIKGLKMIANDIAQLGNNLTIGNKSYTGAAADFQWQPLNYVSPTNIFTGIIDSSDFKFQVERGANSSVLNLNVNPLSKVTIIFTIDSSLSSSTIFEDNKYEVEETSVIRPTGNPIFDLIRYNEDK